MRLVFALPRVPANFLLRKLKDLFTLALLGLAILATTAVAALTQLALGAVLGFLDLQSTLSSYATQAAGVVVMLLLDMAIAALLFGMVSGIHMPRRVGLQAVLIAAVGSTVLRLFSANLAGSVERNPLLASYAAILGLFVWFYLLSQVYMFASAWGAVGTADAQRRNPAARRQQTLGERARRRRNAEGRPR